MNIRGFYLIKEEYIDLINNIGGKYIDKKERPIYCCIEDKNIKGLYWAIPTSNVAHRTGKQMERISNYCSYPKHDIRSAFYYVGMTNRPAIYKISNALPITEKYIEKEYSSKGIQLMLEDKEQVSEVYKKLMRILSYEGRFPNRLEQHITDIKEYLIRELQQENNCEYEEDWELE